MTLPTSAQYQRVVDLLADYALLIDLRRSEEWAALFGETGSLVFKGRSITGLTTLRDFAESARPGTHLGGLPRVRVEGGKLAVSSSFIFVPAHSSVVQAGRYDDEIHDDGETALFARRSIVLRAA